MKNFLSVSAIGVGLICALSASPALAAPTLSNIGQGWDVYTGQDQPPVQPPFAAPMYIPSVWYIVTAYVVPDTTTQTVTVSHDLRANQYGTTYWRQGINSSKSITPNTEGIYQWGFNGRPYCDEVKDVPLTGYYTFTGLTSTDPLSASSTVTYSDDGNGGYSISFN